MQNYLAINRHLRNVGFFVFLFFLKEGFLMSAWGNIEVAHFWIRTGFGDVIIKCNV